MNQIDSKMAKMARAMDGKKVRKWLYDKVYDEYDQVMAELARLRAQLSHIEQANEQVCQERENVRSRRDKPGGCSFAPDVSG